MNKVLVSVYIGNELSKKIVLENLENIHVDGMVSRIIEKLENAGIETSKMLIKDLCYIDPDFEEYVSVDRPFSDQKINSKKYELKLEEGKEQQPIVVDDRLEEANLPQKATISGREFEHINFSTQLPRAIEQKNKSKNSAIYEEQFNSHTMLISSFTYDKLVFDNQTTEYQFILKDFKFKEMICRSKNIVDKYEHIESRKIVAIKSVIIPFQRQSSSPGTPTSDNQSKKMEQEVSALLSVGNHKNIINFYGVSIQDSKLLICMEYMDLTLMNLYSIAHERESCFPENLLGAVTTAILNALNFCKSLNYIHRDIKPDNILVKWSGEIKLADFGEARLMEGSIASTCVGTLRYFAPERFEADLEKYDVRVDVWSLGMTLLECMYGHFPIKDKEGKEISHLSCSKYIKQIDTVGLINNCPQNYADFVYEFLLLCLKEYENRPKYDVLMETEFYLKYNAEMSQPKLVASILARYDDKITDSTQNSDEDVYSQQEDSTSQITEERLELRDYQKELVEVAVTGKNVVICSPTNSGKTFVAIYIIKKHIERCLEENKTFKVCFFVPITSILSQQFNVIKTYLKYKAIKLSGESTAPLRESIQANDIIIITPQMILNLLQGNLIQGYNEENLSPFTLTTFSLLIFDEAHHADECFPYNTIMEYYHDMKINPNLETKEFLPQIIGLTASLGIGKAKTIGEAMENLIKKCANLDAKHLACIEKEENKKQLEEYVAKARDHIEQCNQSFKKSLFYKEFLKITDYYEKVIFGVPEAQAIEIYLKENKSTIEYYIPYITWIFQLEKTICERSKDELSDDSHQKIIISLEKLKQIHKAIEILRLFDSSTALNFLLEQVKTKNAYSENDMFFEEKITHLQSLDEQDPFYSDILRTLFKILEQHFSDGSPEQKESRVIIFLKHRNYALKLANIINDRFPHVRADFLTGTTKSAEQWGTTQEILRQKLKDFNDGVFRVLCSTSVSEEGLDIPGCNLVIKYSYVTNDIANIQRRGRGRDMLSKSILITDDENEIDQENRNIYAEDLMNKALSVLKKKPDSEFKSQVEEKINKMNKRRQEDREISRINVEETKRLSSQVLFKIRCKRCRNVITDSTYIRKAETNFVVSDPNFWELVEIQETPKDAPPKFKNDNGEHNCKQKLDDGTTCGNDLGRIFSFRKTNLPLIKCSGLIFEKMDLKNGKSENITNKQWMKVLTNHFNSFEPSEIDGEELYKMKLAYKSPNQDEESNEELKSSNE